MANAALWSEMEISTSQWGSGPKTGWIRFMRKKGEMTITESDRNREFES